MFDFKYVSLYKDFVEKRQTRKVILYCAGYRCKALIQDYFPHDEIAAIWDNSLEKQGALMHGIMITPPPHVSGEKIDGDSVVVIITVDAPITYLEISEQLYGDGFKNVYPYGIMSYALREQGWRYTAQLKPNYHELNTFPLFEANKERIQTVLDMLEDEKSKYVYSQYAERMKYNMWNYYDLADSHIPKDTYFDFEHWTFGDNEIFIDGGAFDGADTIRLAKMLGDKLAKAFVFEPDDNNFAKLTENICRLIGSEEHDRIRLCKAGLWNESTDMKMMRYGSEASTMAYKDNKLNYPDAPSGGVSAVSLDDMVEPTDKVTMLKLDVEGAELPALQGAAKILKRDKPKLAISIYHKLEDIWELPLYIKSVVPEYRLFVRHQHMYFGDKILYAMV